jgi:hypothetical protein
MALPSRCQQGLLVIYPIQPDKCTAYTQIVDIHRDLGPIRNDEEAAGASLQVSILCNTTN